MIIYTGKDLARSFREVRGNRITIAEDSSEEKYTCQAQLTRRQQEHLALPCR
jgi:hypothetical protein